MLLGTMMVWWIVICQKIDLDVKIKRMLSELDRTYEIVRVEENKEDVKEDELLFVKML